MSGSDPRRLADTPRLAALVAGVDAGPAALFVGSAVPQAVVDRAGRLLRANRALRRLVGEGCPLDDGPPVTTLFAPDAEAGVLAVLRPVLDGADADGVGGAVPLAVMGLVMVDLVVTAVREVDGRVSGVLLHLCDAGGRTGAGTQPVRLSAPCDIGRHAGGVAHDVNNLLAVIEASVAEALARPGSDAGRAEFEAIGDASRRGAVLLRRLLDGGRGRADAAVIRLDVALRAVEPMLRRALGGVALVVTPGPADGAVAIDPQDLDRVLMNLVVNARHAMPSGGTVTVGWDGRDVAASVSRSGDSVAPGRYVAVAVRDTGIGMPPEVVARLFEPFFTTRAGQGGTGLGLASVRDLVREAGGFLEVDTAPGLGTTMRVHLPWHEAPLAGRPIGEGDRPRSIRAGAGAVLLVDDEAALLRLGERALSRAGWEVVVASCAADALAAVREGGLVPGVVVTDLMLPDGDGLALVEAVRHHVPDLPAVLVSGYSNEALRVRAGGAGVSLLAKPYGMATLLDRLDGLVRPRV